MPSIKTQNTSHSYLTKMPSGFLFLDIPSLHHQPLGTPGGFSVAMLCLWKDAIHAESRSLWPFETNISHSAQCLWDSSNLFKASVFASLLLKWGSTVGICHRGGIHSCFEARLGCFPFGQLRKILPQTLVYGSLGRDRFLFHLGKHLSRGGVRSYGKGKFDVIGNSLTLLWRDYTISRPYQRGRKVPIARPGQNLVWIALFFFGLTILLCTWWYLTMVLCCIFLTLNYVRRFSCAYFPSFYPLVKYLLESFCPFFNGLFWYYWVLRVLFVLKMQILCCVEQVICKYFPFSFPSFFFL